MMAPMRVVDYVVVHELAHLKYQDHSSDFWKTIHSVMPDYEQRKEWLRINGPTLQL
ncbi:WLM domain protein [compost metagenome]